MSARDPRITPARPDLASIALRGAVDAARYAAPARHVCVATAAPIRRAPADDAPMDDQLLFGDGFDAFEIAHGWAWGQSRADLYCGYVRAGQLSEGEPVLTHRVAALRAYAFAKPDMKTPPLALLSMNCRVAEMQREGRFVLAHGAGWIWDGHLAKLGAPFPADPAAVAERFLGAPYLWGGKESLGLDCSGLVQMALTACGIPCPRDTDQQEAALGAPVAFDDSLTGLARADLVFWKGHVGMMLDGDRLIHANAHHMETAIEPLRTARDRIAGKGMAISSIRRLPSPLRGEGQSA
jgi:cell wall-associated NlpC family hydrolase